MKTRKLGTLIVAALLTVALTAPAIARQGRGSSSGGSYGTATQQGSGSMTRQRSGTSTRSQTKTQDRTRVKDGSCTTP